jgi:hypothetical protein
MGADANRETGTVAAGGNDRTYGGHMMEFRRPTRQRQIISVVFEGEKREFVIADWPAGERLPPTVVSMIMDTWTPDGSWVHKDGSILWVQERRQRGAAAGGGSGAASALPMPSFSKMSLKNPMVRSFDGWRDRATWAEWRDAPQVAFSLVPIAGTWVDHEATTEPFFPDAIRSMPKYTRWSV